MSENGWIAAFRCSARQWYPGTCRPWCLAPATAVVIVLASGSWWSPCRADQGSDAARVQTAVEQYTAAMELRDRTDRIQSFARAEVLFRQIVEGDESHEPVSNAALYINLGNSALQAERIGPAIVAFRQALSLAPQDTQARQNLQYARTLLPDWIRRQESHGLLDSLFFWRALLTPGQIQVSAAVSFLLAAVLVALSIGQRQPLWRNLAVIPLLAWLAITVSLFVQPDPAAARNTVIVEESVVYTADSENSAPRLSRPLPSGAEIMLLQTRDRWTEVKLPDGRTGWVFSSTVQSLAAPT